ncbi:unnamed protein product [Bursaphelenchus xylophilus]|uniref:(pine wood nematode) hypothetical protein n=1 Tax=Bursaphelenchus xylophilus TaxID=6326 RepID=A0A7I8X1L7_BURXY|nr:unnamed protein product [Bursaphelenchus xylophilus]CAG9130536.1 unnamed protein product [Bursaphelenchus xylophilus]
MDVLDDSICKKEDLPTAIVVKNVPSDLFDSPEMKLNFADMFTQIDKNVRIDYLKGFRRVRVAFSRPEHATAAKLLVEHHEFEGVQMKPFFIQNITVTRRAYQDEEGHLTLPPLEKQFLISPPSSPPVGWVQSTEMAPVICDFDLMAKLAAYSVEEDYEVHGGDPSHPTIVVTPVKIGEDEEKPMRCPPTPLPHTPRPPE